MSHPAVGATAPPFTVTVERGKVLETARATYAVHPAYRTGERPLVPATFLFAAGQTWGNSLERPGDTTLRQAGLEGVHTLHASYTLAYTGQPPRAGDRLTGTTRIADMVEKTSARSGRLAFWHAATTWRDAAGRTVAEDRTVSVEVERASEPDPAAARLEPRQAFHVDQAAVTVAGIRGGTAEPPPPLAFPPLTLTEIVRYQGASQDLEPMHHDDVAARALGFAGAFSVGMLHVGAAAACATQWLGPERLRRLEARFTGLNWPGDTLTYALARLPDAGDGLEHVEATCARQTGERTLTVAMGFARG